MEANLATLLEAVTEAVASHDPRHVAVVQGERERTWVDLDRRAARLAGYLAARGVGRGSRVGIGLYNSIEYLETLYAVFKLRAVPVNVNYRYREAELAHVLNYTQLSAIVFDGSLHERIERVTAGSASVRALVSVEAAPGSAEHRARNSVTFEDAVRAAEYPRLQRSGTDQIIILTGGTTGLPKGVVWDHSGVRAVVSSVYRRLGLPVPRDAAEVVATAARVIAANAAPVMLPASPLMHGTGFFFTLGNLLLGGRIVCLTNRSLDPAELWGEVQKHRVQELAIVGDAFAKPLVAELARAHRQGRPYDLRSLRRIVSSGVRWSSEVKEQLLRWGRMTLQDSIASSEGGPYGVSLVGPGTGPVSPRFILPPNARVIAPDGTDVVPGSGQVGELASTGALPLGYFDDPAATAAVFRTIDGIRYAVPGDAAMVEADGSLTLLGRGSGVINTGGEKVFAEEVEQALLRHPGVAEAVVVGVPDDKWGSRVTALVRPADGPPPTADALAVHVGELLAGYKRPRQVFFVDHIERTASGKTNRQWAAQRAGQLATRRTDALASKSPGQVRP